MSLKSSMAGRRLVGRACLFGLGIFALGLVLGLATRVVL